MDEGAGVRMPKACRTCARAKVRCEPESDGTCKRCRRLSKECVIQTPGAHRRQRLGTVNSQVAGLDQKLDRMAAMLAASAHVRNGERGGHSSPPTSSPSVSIDGTDAIPSVEEGQVYMEVFSIHMAPLFPFVLIPAHITADELRRERPFLYVNIAMAACQKASRQRELAKTARRYIAEHIIMNGEHSLDLLQGLLVHLAWHHLHIQRNAQLDALVHLTMAQLISLGFNQDATKDHSKWALSYLTVFDIESHQPPMRTLEERRAYLGCYCLTSMILVCTRDMDTIRCTKYTDECCHALTDATEYTTDAYLVHLVRLSQLGERIHRTFSSNDFDTLGALPTPLGLSVRWHQAELRQLKASLPSDIPQSAILLFHYYTLEILLYRIGLLDETPDLRYGDYPVTQLDVLFHCLESTKSFFNGFYSLESTYFHVFPYTFWSQFGHAIVILSRLSLHQSDRGDWDRHYVRCSIDYYETVDKLQKKLKEALPLAEQQGGSQHSLTELPEIFMRLSSRIRLMKDTHRRMQEAQNQSAAQPTPTLADYDFMLGMPYDFSFSQIPDLFDALV